MKPREILPANDLSLKILLATSLILLALFGRLLPHPANFTPLAAVAIFAGMVLPRRWALILPFAAMVLSDLVIGLHPLIFFTWGSFVAIAWLSNTYLTKISPLRVLGASLSASLLFFVVTNFGVWLQGRMYTMDLAGLVHCYANALPFFRNTLLGDLTFTIVLFGTYALASRLAFHDHMLHEPIRA